MDHLGLNHPSVSVRGTEKGKVLEYYRGVASTVLQTSFSLHQFLYDAVTAKAR